MLRSIRKSSSASHTLAVLAVLVMSALGATTASAQEDVNSDPPPLQWPTPVSANPKGQLPFQVGDVGLRRSIEDVADAMLCEMLMKDANAPIPNEANFTYADCPSGYKTMINLRQGKFSWADGARPTECGLNCIGQPFMSQTQSLNRPNARFAMVYGHLTFQGGVGPLNRNVTYFLEIHVTCDVPTGTRDGTANITTLVDGPVADDPGFLETIVNFLVLPLEISQRITDAISRLYRVSTNPGPNQGPCSSIGAFASDPANFKFDAFTWDVPSPKHPGRGAISDVAAIKPTATLYFDRITRNHTIESNPSTAPFSFTLYINGVPAHIPPSGSISLPPSGGSSDQRYCRTITMDSVNSLQILFVDSLGGTVWSQFSPAQNFGSGGAHKMTTGRGYLTPGLHPGDKPIHNVARDFELDYRVDYHAAPTSVAVTSPPTGGRPGAVTSSGLVTDQPPPNSTCIKF
jgi:hypothetical protein